MRRLMSAAVMVAQLGGGSNSGTGPVSPAVLATTMTVMNAPGIGTLDLLVLWRGTPGWFMRTGGQGGGGSSSSGGDVENGLQVRVEWISQGGVRLNLRFEPKSRRLWILDKEIVLDDANVVLVDGVDETAGPRVVATLHIDPGFDTAVDLPPRMPGGPRGALPGAVPAQTFIRRAPELVSFLQCDARAPNASAYEQKIFDMWCSWVTEP